MSEEETSSIDETAASAESDSASEGVSTASMDPALASQGEDGPTAEMPTPQASESHRDAVLAIETPVTVTLARKKERLDRILAMAPGAMLTFDTHCDEPLVLEAGGHPIATGETVKIGDKFGIRVRTFIDPEDLE